MADTESLRQRAQARSAALIDQLRQLVSCESPSGDTAALRVCADLLADWGTAALGRPPQRVIHNGQAHLLWAAEQQDVLLLGHYDTVWPAGTLKQWPFTLTGPIATGPGVCDMKAGIVQMLTALTLLPDPSRVGLLLTCDEEVGSVTSRPLIEQQAQRSRAVLVGEPSTEHGELKIARKGGSMYEITILGRAAHAGVEPHRGINAAVELAYQVLALRELGSDGTSVTPTLLAAGLMTNQVPESAKLCVDVRAWSRGELDRVDRVIRSLPARLEGARLVVGGGVNRYPLPEAVALGLFGVAARAAHRLGLSPLAGAHAPGASDANFTGSLGVPTLDGLGGVGGGSHARSEWVDVSQMADRTALLAAIISDLLSEPPAVSGQHRVSSAVR